MVFVDPHEQKARFFFFFAGGGDETFIRRNALRLLTAQGGISIGKSPIRSSFWDSYKRIAEMKLM